MGYGVAGRDCRRLTAAAPADLPIVFAQSVNHEVEQTLDQPPYTNLSLSSVTAYGGPTWQAAPTNITVHVSRTSNQESVRLAERLEHGIEQRTNHDVRITVEYTESQTVDSTARPVQYPVGLTRCQCLSGSQL